MFLIMTMTIDVYEAGTPPPIVLRQRLRIARENAGLEQEELAALIGVSRNTISNAEKGKVRPRPITINAIALATGVPASWFKEGDPPADQLPARPGTPAGSAGDDRHPAKVSGRRKRQPVGYPFTWPRAVPQLRPAM